MVKTILFIWICVFILMAKSFNAYKQHSLIINAIFEYRKYYIRKGVRPIIGFNDMEPFLKTVFRLWDWGYVHILRPYDYRVIRPYIEEIKAKKK